jgi:hypothetical protein
MGPEVPVIQLTPEQQAAFEGGEHLVQDEAYRRLRDLLEDGPLTGGERQAILKGVWDRADWSDSRMDVYDSRQGLS